MPFPSQLPLTPLQDLLGFDYLPHRYHGAIELLFAFVCFGAAIALRRRRRIITSPSLVMLGFGAFIDLFAGAIVSNPKVANLLGAIAVLSFLWGVIRLLMDAVDYSSRRDRRDASNILRDLISLILYAAVLVGVLAADFQVNVYSLVASVGVLGVVIGFAVQQTLGDIFSGLALQLQRPFEHGDWVRSGQFLGRVQSIGMRSTTVLTRGNERLEIPNSAIAKEVLT
ncbi:MAG TPA: mechanosensitive ion channel domain-containing protein, partial [Candidatus Binataceae bacterium]|nr:mechanosensitive ion channel domain-containing protein [Candidatus Binataceae bacterium]